MEWWDELKRRNVVRAVIAYAAAAFVILQVADLTFEPLGLPDWVYRFVVVASILGFPVTVAASWFFELRSGRLERDRRPGGTGEVVGPGAAGSRASPLVAVGVVGGTLALAGVVTVLLRPGLDRPAGAVDQDLIAVAPFRVASSDPALAYLREGMVDLLGAKLRESPRTVDPRTLFSAWQSRAGDNAAELPRDEALALAASLGAGRILLGSIVGSPAELTLAASLVEVPGGRTLSEATLEAPADSLAWLVDGLASRLVGAQAGAPMERITSGSVEAVRRYLDGLAAYRRGDFEGASDAFLRALDRDSTFAAAALGAFTAGAMKMAPPDSRRPGDLAWTYRDRLTEDDRLVLLAILGKNYPGVTPLREQIEFQREVTERLPDRVEAWYEYGDHLFHYGAMAGLSDDLMRGAEAFRRSIAVDSTFFNGRLHLAWLYRTINDARWREVTPVSPDATPEELFRFGGVSVAPDSGQRDAMFALTREDLEAMESTSLIGIPANTAGFLTRPEWAPPMNRLTEIAFELLRDRDLAPSLRETAENAEYGYLMNLSRWTEAETVSRRMAARAGASGELAHAARMMERPLLWGGPGGPEVEAAARELTRWWAGARPDPDALASEDHVERACLLGLHAVGEDQPAVAREVAERLDPSEPRSAVERSGPLSARRTCALLLRAAVEHAEGRAPSTERPALAELRSWLDMGPAGARVRLMANLVTARILNDLDRHSEAFSHARRVEKATPDLFASYVRPLLEAELEAVEGRGEELGARTVRRRLETYGWREPASR